MTTDTNRDYLLAQCRSIARDIAHGTWDGFEPTEDNPEPNGVDYLSDAFDIEYIVNSKREYLGARVLVAFGGPDIWINTRTKTVEGAWWGTYASATYQRDNLGLDEALEMLWEG